VQRHAGAGTVWIRIVKTRRLTRMEVRDNGRGMSAAAAEEATGMGLLGMRERALSLGGVLRIAPGTRRGTRLEVLLPDAT
jgi:signal transduction histidine kinase